MYEHLRSHAVMYEHLRSHVVPGPVRVEVLRNPSVLRSGWDWDCRWFGTLVSRRGPLLLLSHLPDVGIPWFARVPPHPQIARDRGFCGLPEVPDVARWDDGGVLFPDLPMASRYCREYSPSSLWSLLRDLRFAPDQQWAAYLPEEDWDRAAAESAGWDVRESARDGPPLYDEVAPGSSLVGVERLFQSPSWEDGSLDDDEPVTLRFASRQVGELLGVSWVVMSGPLRQVAQRWVDFVRSRVFDSVHPGHLVVRRQHRG